MRLSFVAAGLLLATGSFAHAADPAVTIKAAWVPAADKGADTNLYMTIENHGAEDAITRVRCEAANFTELRIVDRGEGFPSARGVKTIPIAAGGETALTSEGFNVRLLQLTGPLEPGTAFDCSLRLRGGGQPKVVVTVRPAEAKPE